MARSLIVLLLLGLLATSHHFAAVEARSGHHGEQLHFVLVHGAGHGAWCWYKIITLLQKVGHKVTAIDLTSNGNSKVVADTVTSVAQFVQPLTQFLANEVQVPEKVILVGHSFGGSSITYAMELFSKKIDKAIFLAAFMPSNNQTFGTVDIIQAQEEALIQQGVIILNFANGASMPPTSFSFNLTFVEQFLYNESPIQDVNLGKALLNPTPNAPFGEVLTLTPTKYGSIKRFYIKTDLDHTIPPALQDIIIQQNTPHEEFFIPKSDHSPFFSKHVILTNLLLSIATK